jgi:hypothetical protein
MKLNAPAPYFERAEIRGKPGVYMFGFPWEIDKMEYEKEFLEWPPLRLPTEAEKLKLLEQEALKEEAGAIPLTVKELEKRESRQRCINLLLGVAIVATFLTGRKL